MSKITVTTNNQPRLLLDWDQLTEREQGEFSYLDKEHLFDASFVRYRKWVYDTRDFMRVSEPMQKDFGGKVEWGGYYSDSFFSGVLLKFTEEDCDRVVMATYIVTS